MKVGWKMHDTKIYELLGKVLEIDSNQLKILEGDTRGCFIREYGCFTETICAKPVSFLQLRGNSYVFARISWQEYAF